MTRHGLSSKEIRLIAGSVMMYFAIGIAAAVCVNTDSVSAFVLRFLHVLAMDHQYNFPLNWPFVSCVNN